jgi:hypothetical protein
MWMHQYEVNLQELHRLYQQGYPVTKVFCVFEDERGQRKCLEKLTIGYR